MRRRIPARAAAFVWPVLAAMAAVVPVTGAFSTTNVFYVRDLGMYFWPRHLWLRQTVLTGNWPLWDPHAGGGQSAVADALNQFFLLPVSIGRLLLPDVVGFNIWVAAPFPLMALGAWLWLRRHASPPAACVGAAIYAVAGPIVSTGNFPNLSWAVALLPWILWAVDRVAERPGAGRIASLAICVSMQAVAGEPVTLAATGVLAIAYAAFGSPADGRQDRWRRTARVAMALMAGALLSSVQMMPLLAAASRSPRSAGIDALFWSLHPLELAESVVAHLFGHPYHAALDRLPWVTGMHDREPFLFSLYAGLGAIALAAISTAGGVRRHGRRFWSVVAAVALVCALGDYTPVYPMLQAAVPPLQSFRFPVKYLVFCTVALAALTAAGADALVAHARGRAPMTRPVLALAIAAGVAGVSALLAVTSSVFPGTALALWEAVARLANIDDPRESARWLLGPSVSLFAGVALLGMCVAVLLVAAWQRHRLAPLAAVTICVLAVVDPLVVNRDVHPTMAASTLGPPAWATVTRSHPDDRVYVGGRVRRLPPRVPRVELIDTLDRFDMPADVPPQEAVTRLSAQFAYTTAPWGLRESISYDLPELWPREYSMMIDVFRWAPREARLRFLDRTGVRYCYLPEPPHPGAQPLTRPVALTGPMALYECGSNPRRVYVTPDAHVETDLAAQIDRMFDAAHDPDSRVLLEREPPAPAGRPGTPAVAPDAQVVSERNTELVVRASVGAQGGYLNVIDSYDPGWRVEVDGEPAILLRGNALYRAVRLAPGQHEVRFRYRPIPFLAGLMVTMATLLALLIGWARELTAREPDRRMRQAVTA